MGPTSLSQSLSLCQSRCWRTREYPPRISFSLFFSSNIALPPGFGRSFGQRFQKCLDLARKSVIWWPPCFLHLIFCVLFSLWGTKKNPSSFGRSSHSPEFWLANIFDDPLFALIFGYLFCSFFYNFYRLSKKIEKEFRWNLTHQDSMFIIHFGYSH